MLDLGHLPNFNQADVQVFTGPVVTVNLQWQSYQVPRGKSMLYAFIVGGGGGGGGGFTGIASSARGGGGGGGSGAQIRLIAPIYLLPEILFIQAGSGGLGVGSGGTAGDGTDTYISADPSTNAADVLAVAFAGLHGVSGTASAGGGGGAAGTTTAASSMALIDIGIFISLAGQAGVAGGAQTGANGTAITIPNTSITQGGSGGGGTTSADFAGGACTALAGTTWLNEQRPATPAAGSFNGSAGPQIWERFFSFGGLGGSSSNAGVGGAGGRGAYGAGGGGGGGGTTGGRGGDGGGGLVIIIAW